MTTIERVDGRRHARRRGTDYMGWHSRAVCSDECVDPKVFSEPNERAGRPLERAVSRTLVAARTYCDRCPVMDRCLEQGVRQHATGVYGGIMLYAGHRFTGSRPRVAVRPMAPDEAEAFLADVHRKTGS
jgi:hypothetical protein